MKLKSTLLALTFVVVFVFGVRAAEPTEVTSLDDIKSWVGEGQNQIGVLIDFCGCGAWAWGYRWNGERPDNETILTTILAADPRLKLTDEDGLRGLVYDVADTGMAIELTPGELSWEGEDEVPSIIWGMEDGETLAWQWLEDEDQPWIVLTLNEANCDFDDLSDPWWAAEPYEGGGGGGGDDEKGFTFDDIHFWVGEGENQCAIVIDFFSDKAWAWGYRWSGNEPPSVDQILKEIVDEDHRLTMVSSDSSWGLYMQGFGYDVNDTHPKMDFVSAMYDDADAVYGMEDQDNWFYYVNFLTQTTGKAYRTTYDYTRYSDVGVSGAIAENGGWYTMSLNGWLQDGDLLAEPVAAESPYGYAVVDSYTEASNAWYNDPSVTLGRPTAWNDEDRTFPFFPQPAYPVTPATPAYGEKKLLTLQSSNPEDAFVTIKFDHNVVDDPMNPFGLDLIVFGNSAFTGTGGTSYGAETDPDTYTFANAGGFNEPGSVEVSQDGKTWDRFETGRYCDDFPTLGYVFDAERPDKTLFAANEWWGKKADACRPVDPRVSWKSAAGLTCGEMARRFNGSAGGTGFDIRDLKDFDKLAADEHGRKWIRYVRISNMIDPNGRDDETTTPEVDAVADVAPVSGYELWVLDNYGFANAWDKNVTGRDVVSTNYDYVVNEEGVEVAVKGAISSNGRSNGVCQLLGIALDDSAATALDFRIDTFEATADGHVLTLLSNRPLTADCGIAVKGASKLTAKTWTTLETTFESCAWDADAGCYRAVFSVPSGDARFFRMTAE